MATDNTALLRKISQAKALAVEIRKEAKTGISDKDLKQYLTQKDAIVTTGQHHASRNVTAGQIAGDLESFAEDMEHLIKERAKKEAGEKKKK
jgi:hypothetical protein